MARQYAVPGPLAAFLNDTNPRTEALAGGTFVTETTLSSVAPGVGSLVITGFAPSFIIRGTTTTFTTAGNRAGRSAVIAETSRLSVVVASPAVLSETLPTAASVAPGAGAIVVTGFAPSVMSDRVVAPAAGTIVLTGAAPTTTIDSAVAPGVGSLVLTGRAPTVAGNVAVAPGGGAILVSGFAPSLSQAATPDAGSIRFAGFAPTPIVVAASGQLAISVIT